MRKTTSNYNTLFFLECTTYT